ncbi:MAG: endonuclease/exonuclease/phosphatase family protein [Phycisphaerae bacterium]|nr:endonuclease/exonuclease/phosphatase family protein [Phycisphaerae bacterium]
MSRGARHAGWLARCAASAATTAALAQTPSPDPANDPQPARHDGTVIRVATFNVQDIRTAALATGDHPRLKRLAEVLQRLRPNVVLLNEIAYDGPGAPGATEPHGQNGQRFAEKYLAVPQAEGLRPLSMRVFMAPVNTGIPSGLDLDRNGRVVTAFPPLGSSAGPGAPAEPTPEGREFGGDCWGFGTFPGQYGMALLVDERLEIRADAARTFRLFPWSYMDGPLMPTTADGTTCWWPGATWSLLRLSSKSHWDVPVRLPTGQAVHFLCSHPTPPVFDGEEKRNAKRNHDEIRFWADYLEGAGYIVDDVSKGGGLPRDASFVILGDLNADPEKGQSLRNPIGVQLCGSPRVNCAIVPRSDVEVPGLSPTDTAFFKLRVDYVLPSRDLGVAAAGVWRHPPEGSGGEFPSDHFPVWMDLLVPAGR